MKIKHLTVAGILALALLAAAVLPRARRGPAADFDGFALCLSDKKITMYGADWCPHCQNEKNAFGGSFRLVPYVECPAEPKKCLAAGVNAYPTWIFPDGRKFEGEQGLEKLSLESGCPLKNNL